jgi:DNA-binding PadR family transcriptional regulator
MNLTNKQLQLINLLGKRNSDGSALDLDQISDGLPYKPSKQSLQFSIRALIAHGLIQKDAPVHRRGRMRCVISLTRNGEQVAGTGKPNEAVVVDADTDALLQELNEVFEPI